MAMITTLPLINSSVNAQIYISGDISGTLVDTTYIVENDITIPAGQQLIIEAGARLEFYEGRSLYIGGRLLAYGTEQDSIYFVRHEADLPWAGINILIENFQNISRLSYCYISGSNDIGIDGNDNEMQLRHCVVENNSNIANPYIAGGIYNIHCAHDTILYKCKVVNNDGDGAQFGIGGGLQYIVGSDFSNNSGTGATVFVSGFISKCAFTNNYEGGLNIVGTLQIDSCLIADNYYEYDGGGIRANHEVNMSHSIVVNNTSDYRGGGIFTEYVYLDNCIFINNSALYGSAIFTDPGFGSTIKNCIIADNTDGPAYVIPSHTFSSVRYNNFYNNLEGNRYGEDLPSEELVELNYNSDPCDSSYNIYLNPMISNPENFDFELLPGSPCIDAGSPDLPYDPDGTISDIGAYFFNQSFVTPDNCNNISPETFEITLIYPNPANSSFRVQYFLESPAKISISLYNLLGQIVHYDISDSSPAGFHEIHLNAENLSSGTYYLRMQSSNNGYSESRKIILLR